MNSTVYAAVAGLVLGASACRTDGLDHSMHSSVPIAAEPGATAAPTPAETGKMACSAEMMGTAKPAEPAKAVDSAKMSCSAEMMGTGKPSAAPPVGPVKTTPSAPAKPSDPAPTPSATGTAAPPSTSAGARPKHACGTSMECGAMTPTID